MKESSLLSERKKQWYFISEKHFFIASGTLLVAVAFFYSLQNIALATLDDEFYYLQAVWWKAEPTLGKTIKGLFEYGLLQAKTSGRFYPIYGYPLFALPYLPHSPIAMQVIRACAVSFSVISAMVLIAKHLNKNLAWLVGILFFAFAQINNQHNIFICYILYHQITMGFLFLSIERFLCYYKAPVKHQKTLIASALFYFIPVFLYEAFLFYCIFFAMISFFFLYTTHANWGKRALHILLDLKYHILVCLLFIIVYFGWQYAFPVNYDGATISFNSFGATIKTIFSLSFGLFPLRSFRKYGNGFHALLQHINLSSILLSLLIASIVVAILRFASKKIMSIKQLLLILAFCFGGIILPNIIFGLTPKYVDWVINYNEYGFVGSYFSYFFIITSLAAFLFFIYQHFNFENKKVAQVCIFSLVCIIALFTNANNEFFAQKLNTNYSRILTFDAFVQTDNFLEVPENAQIWMPDYDTSQSGDLQYWNALASTYQRRLYICVATKEELDIDSPHPIYTIRYDEKTDLITFAKLDKNLLTEELFLFSRNPVQKFTLLFEQKKPNEIYSEQQVAHQFGQDIILPITYCDSSGTWIIGKDLDLEHFQIASDFLHTNAFST